RTWVTGQGYPHTVDAHVQERYTRVDRNDMKLSITFDDPKMYTKPFQLGTNNYKWLTNQKINEWLCVPSDVIKYLSEVGDPAGNDPDAPADQQRIGRGRGSRPIGRKRGLGSILCHATFQNSEAYDEDESEVTGVCRID